MSWATFIETAPRCDHAVQVYGDLDELGDSVVRYLGAGFALDAPAVVIAMAEHWYRFSNELETRGWEPADLERRGLLTHRHAEETLDLFMDGDRPSAEQFEATVGRLIEDVEARFPGKTIRVFGEMVDLLWQRGDRRAALAVEDLWNQLAVAHAFALLCGYHLDIFNIDTQTADLPDIFGPHTHARPVADPPRLAAALDRALKETVGPRKAAHIYLKAAEQVPRGPLPRAQAILTWLSAEDRSLTKNVLERASFHYAT